MAHFDGAGSFDSNRLGWDLGPSSWSTGLTKEHFNSAVVGQQMEPSSDRGRASGSGSRQNQTGNWYSEARLTDMELAKVNKLEKENHMGNAFVDGWDDRMKVNESNDSTNEAVVFKFSSVIAACSQYLWLSQ
ncbi:Hypothetical predicted protein [Olea europaea subsp. europaea]|uniref:Uncharacterized protein n=1 Tax=Olea europaea subsp. europaea TaxID=158383 RepID=A0A8S0PS73_OLEEU|nr:Hypothetical predicted protein [Olea europaea subsp. europaea]